MNESSCSPNGKSTQKIILLCALPAFLVAFLVLFSFVIRKPPAQESQSTTLQETDPNTPPIPVSASLSAPAHAAQGFDLFFKKNDPAGAKTVFEACIREHPEYADAYHGLAMAQRETGDPAKAIPNHDRSIELSPQRADYYRVRGITYQRLNDQDAAIKSFEDGLKARDTRFCSPGFLQAHLVQCYRTKGDFQKALAYAEEALTLNPQSQWFYL